MSDYEPGAVVDAAPDVLRVRCNWCVAFAMEPCIGLPADKVHASRAVRYEWKHVTPSYTAARDKVLARNP